jgi:hypothetical protein
MKGRATDMTNLQYSPALSAGTTEALGSYYFYGRDYLPARATASIGAIWKNFARSDKT